MTPRESVIRDQLSQNLSLLEPELSLLDIEKYVPNRSGSRGFIDILARDRRGRYVLIELKRSDAAGRQAVHEVLKYVEGLKVLLAAKEEELRVFLVSTEWAEMLVPFSSLRKRVGFEVRGFALEVDESGKATSAESVVPLTLSEDRLFAPWHEARHYTNPDEMQDALSNLERACSQKGISDYVVIQLRAHPSYHSAQVAATRVQMNALAARFSTPAESFEHIEKPLDQRDHMLYFSMVQLDDDYCLARIKALASAEDLEEFLPLIEEESNKEVRACHLHEKLLEVGQNVVGYFEIAYPAKFTRFIDQEHWTIERIYKFGALKRNQLLSDETIIEEVKGLQGVTRQRFKKSLDNPTINQIIALRQEILKCLRDNPQWGSQIARIFDHLERNEDLLKIDINVYNPSNTLLSIYLLHSRDDGLLYFPEYRISINEKWMSYDFVGFLVPRNNKPSLRAVIDNNYDGIPAKALYSLNWGGYENSNARVTRDCGLDYGTFKVEANGQTYRLNDFGFDRCDHKEVSGFFNVYLVNNQDFIKDVCTLFSDSWDGVMVHLHDAVNFEPST